MQQEATQMFYKHDKRLHCIIEEQCKKNTDSQNQEKSINKNNKTKFLYASLTKLSHTKLCILLYEERKDSALCRHTSIMYCNTE